MINISTVEKHEHINDDIYDELCILYQFSVQIFLVRNPPNLIVNQYYSGIYNLKVGCQIINKSK